MDTTVIHDEEGNYVGRTWRCACGATVEAFGYDTDCHECGRSYNAFGQELAPRAHWDERDDY